jgi:hypothetical protein
MKDCFVGFIRFILYPVMCVLAAQTCLAAENPSASSTLTICAGDTGSITATVTGGSEDLVWVAIVDYYDRAYFATNIGTAAITYTAAPSEGNASSCDPATATCYVYSSAGNGPTRYIYIQGISSVACDQGAGPFCGPQALTFTAETTPVTGNPSGCNVTWSGAAGYGLKATNAYNADAPSSSVSAYIGSQSPAIGTSSFRVSVLTITVVDSDGNPVGSSSRNASPGCCLYWGVSCSGGVAPYTISVSRNPSVPTQNPCGIGADPATLNSNQTNQIHFPTTLSGTMSITITATDNNSCSASKTVSFNIAALYTIACTLSYGEWEQLPVNSIVAQQVGVPQGYSTTEIQEVYNQYESLATVSGSLSQLLFLLPSQIATGGAAVLSALSAVSTVLAEVAGPEIDYTATTVTTQYAPDYPGQLLGAWRKVIYCTKTIQFNNCEAHTYILKKPIGMIQCTAPTNVEADGYPVDPVGFPLSAEQAACVDSSGSL